MELVIYNEEMGQLTSSLEHVVYLFYEMTGIFLCKVIVIGLKHEQLVDLRALRNEETTDHLGLGKFLEQVLVLTLISMLRVCSH